MTSPDARSHLPVHEGSAPLSGSHRWAFWVLWAVLLLTGLALWSPIPGGVWHDDGVYLLLGKSLAQGEGLRYLGVSGAPLAPKFPPAYPLVVAAVWKLVPGFPGNLAVVQILNILFVSAAGALFGWFARRFTGLPLLPAIGVTVLAWSSADLWRFSLIPLSEPLFLLSLILVLAAGSAMEREPGYRWAAALLIAFLLAFHTRTLGVAVGLGAVLALWLSRRRVWSAVLGVGMVLLSLPWILWSGRAAREIPEPLQDILGPYGGWFLHQVASEPMRYLSTLPGEAWALVDGTATLLLPTASPVAKWLAAAVLLVPLAVGLPELGRRSRTALWALLLFLGILWLWPFQDRRLLLPVFPLLVLSMVLGFQWLTERVSSRRWLALGVSTVGALWGFWFAGESWERLASGWPTEVYEVRATALGRALEAIETTVPEGAVIGAPELWAGIHLYTGRTVAPSARFLPLAEEGPSWGTPEEQYRLWIAAGIDHVLVEHGGGVHAAPLTRMDELCPGGAVQLLASMPGAFLVRLNWDAECKGRLLEGGS